MRNEKRMILELGYCPLEEEIIERIVKGYLAPCGYYNLIEKESHYWEIQVSHGTEIIELMKIEGYIIAELRRLTNFRADLKLLGI